MIEILARLNLVSDKAAITVNHIQTEMNCTYEHCVINDPRGILNVMTNDKYEIKGTKSLSKHKVPH